MPTIYCAEDQKMVLGLSCPQVQVGTRIERGAPSAMRHSPRLLLRPQKVAARSFRGCSRVARLVRQVSGFSGVKTAGGPRGHLLGTQEQPRRKIGRAHV